MRTWLPAILIISVVSVLVAVSAEAPPTGTVKLSSPDAEIQLRDAAGAIFTVVGTDPGKALPAGDYSPVALRIIKRDKDSADVQHTWVLTAKGPEWGKLAKVTVVVGQATELMLGEPITMKAPVSQENEYASIGCSIAGVAGEEYFPAAYKDGLPLSPPSLEIVDEAGKVLGSGQLAFG